MVIATKMLLTLLASLFALQVAHSQDALFLQSYANFALDLYMAIADGNYNNDYILSPLSVDVCLSVLFLGSSGKVFQDLLQGLRFPSNYSVNLIQSNSNLLLKNMAKTGGVEVAMKIYMNENYRIQTPFKNAAIKYFLCEVENMYFGDTKAAVKEINDFISHNTHGMIEGMLEENDIVEKTVMVIVNVIYFKGLWVYKFNKTKTAMREFMLADGTTKQVKMMTTNGEFMMANIKELDWAKVVELPYANSSLTLTCIQPQSPDGLPKLIRQLKEYNWTTMSASLRSTNMSVTIPKFNATLKQYLNVPLIRMGMEDLFNMSLNKFDRIAHSQGHAVDLHLDYVLHQAVINVDEDGTRAAAATITTARSIPPSFLGDSPFIYALRTKSMIYFLGQFTGNS